MQIVVCTVEKNMWWYKCLKQWYYANIILCFINFVNLKSIIKIVFLLRDYFVFKKFFLKVNDQSILPMDWKTIRYFLFKHICGYPLIKVLCKINKFLFGQVRSSLTSIIISDEL